MISLLSRLPKQAPGLAAAVGTATAATCVASALPATLHISAIPVSILLGGACRNLVLTPSVTSALEPGLKLATSTVLRTGIVCVGAKLSAAQILALGWTTVPAAACSVGVGVSLIPRIAQWAGLAPRLGALLACGTSICGVTAISAVAPAIAATQAEVAIAVANVVAFGTIGMLAYPHLAATLFASDNSRGIGLFLGLAVHDTSQVMGCAASYAEQYADAAVVGAAAVTKLTRNVFLAAVVPLLAVRYGSGPGVSGGAAKSIAAAVPTFVLGFVAMAVARTAGDAYVSSGQLAGGIVDAQQWKRLMDWVGGDLGTKYLLGTGLAAVGLSVDVAVFRGVGLTPFAVGAAGASLVGGTGLAVALLLSSVAAATPSAVA